MATSHEEKVKAIKAAFDPPFLSVSEVAFLLNISKRSVHNLIDQHGLPALKFGNHNRLVRIRPKDLENFIEKNLR